MRPVLAALVVVALSPAAGAEELGGKVVLVSEGEVLAIQHGDATTTLRLQGVDCPEPGQRFAEPARELTSRLALGKTVRATVTGKTAQGQRLVRICVEGKCLEEELLSAGLAWHDREDRNDRLATLEKEARAARKGLWVEPRPVPPWEWRKTHLQGTMVKDAPGFPAVDVSHPVCVDPRSRLAHWFTCEQARGLSCKYKDPAVARSAGFQLHKCLTEKPPTLALGQQAPSCKKDRDCVFRPRPACGCPPCGEQRREAVTRAEAARLARESAAERRRCPKVKCAKCPAPPRWIGKRAVCVDGQCQVR